MLIDFSALFFIGKVCVNIKENPRRIEKRIERKSRKSEEKLNKQWKFINKNWLKEERANKERNKRRPTKRASFRRERQSNGIRSLQFSFSLFLFFKGKLLQFLIITCFVNILPLEELGKLYKNIRKCYFYSPTSPFHTFNSPNIWSFFHFINNFQRKIFGNSKYVYVCVCVCDIRDHENIEYWVVH